MAKIAGDTVQDFIDNAHRKFGGDDFGATSAEIKPGAGQFKDGKIAGVTFKLSVDVDFAEVGSGKPDKENAAAIKDLAARVMKHEKKHETGYKAAFAKWDPAAAAKKIMAKTYANKQEAADAIAEAAAEANAELKKACLALHAKEGIFNAKVAADGSITITEKPAGAKGCD